MSKPFLKTLIKQRHAIFPLIYEFNMRPARYIHETWVAPIIDVSLFKKLTKSDRTEKRLSLLVLREFHLDEEYCFDFDDLAWRLALIDGESLGKLVFLTGVAMNAITISRAVDKETVLSLTREIGDEAHLFALKKAPFLIGRMEFPFAETRSTETFRSHVLACGWRCLQSCFAGAPQSLTGRLSLKLPKELCQGAIPETGVEEKNKAWSLLRKVLLQEVEPRWAACFS